MCGNTFQNTPGQVVIQHCARWGALCKTTNCEIICCDFTNCKSLHLFSRNELGKIRWCSQAAPKLPWSLSMPHARGTCSFCAWKASQHIPFKVAPFFPCSSHGCAAPEESCISVLFRRKAGKLWKRGIAVFVGIYSRIQFTRRVLLAPGLLCAWITAPFEPFWPPLMAWADSLVTLTSFCFCFAMLGYFFIKKYCLFALAVVFIGLMWRFLDRVFIWSLAFFLRGGVGWSKPFQHANDPSGL